MTRLWETDHPGTCEPGDRDHPIGTNHHAFGSWAEFIEWWGHRENDTRLVFRWDWYEAYDQEADEDAVSINYVHQAAAQLHTAEVTVDKGDEPKVRRWLAAQKKVLLAGWAPL